MSMTLGHTEQLETAEDIWRELCGRQIDRDRSLLPDYNVAITLLNSGDFVAYITAPIPASGTGPTLRAALANLRDDIDGKMKWEAGVQEHLASRAIFGRVDGS